MDSNAYGAIANQAIGALPDEQLGLDTIAQRLLRGENLDTVLLVQVFFRPIDIRGEIPTTLDAIGAMAIADVEDALFGAGPDEFLLLGDGPWCGRPDDFGGAHLEARPRIIETGEFREDIPYLPEQDRRATTTVATIRAANGDGYLDPFMTERAIDGLILRGWLTETDDYSANWLRLFEAVGRSADPELDECAFEIGNIASRLEVPTLLAQYAGTGGQQGDARLAGKWAPLVFGDCYNVEPDLESFADNIDRWSAGALIDVTTVRDSGAPLIWDGNNYATYTELRNAVVADGFFTKALGIGRTKRGSQALGRVTGDVRGPHDTTAAVLLALARGPAALPDSLINVGSFGVLPDWKINLFLKGDRQVLVAELYDALLRPFNAWYGSTSSSQLQVGLVETPVGAATSWSIEAGDIFENTFRVKSFDTPPRFRMAVTAERNWTPMSPDELIDYTENPDVSQADWERLQREEETVVIEDLGVRFRHADAIDALSAFGAIRGYFTDRADAEKAGRRIFELLKRPMRKVELATSLKSIFANPGQAGVVAYEDRLGMGDGLQARIVSKRFGVSDRSIGLTTLVMVDAPTAGVST